ncbi:MAG: enoyl-CoA hydratase-related protein [Anaerolineales bacterium]|jgi:enoyl-CoA hydratase
MSYKMIETEVRGRVGLIRINRPKALNALNSTVMGEISQALSDFDGDPEVGAIVITGSEKAFAAGADIKEMMDSTAAEMLDSPLISRWGDIRRIQKPILAAVSGWCLGGGNELAMACDMIVASESAKFGQPEINLGIFPGAGGTQRLTRAVGKAIAMEVILNDRVLSAEEALQHGLVNRVVPVESCLEEALKLADQIAQRAPLAVRLAKQMVNQAEESALTDGIADERRTFNFLFSTEDQKEGMKAFVEKRKPKWKGR